MESENEIQELQNKISKLESELKDIKNDYHSKFTALIFAAKTHDAVSASWIKLCVDLLLKEDEDWWGHDLKEKADD